MGLGRLMSKIGRDTREILLDKAHARHHIEANLLDARHHRSGTDEYHIYFYFFTQMSEVGA